MSVHDQIMGAGVAKDDLLRALSQLSENYETQARFAALYDKTHKELENRILHTFCKDLMKELREDEGG